MADRDTALFTGAEWKAGYYELTGTVTFADALLAILIPAISEQISQECGRAFTAQTHTKRLDGSGTPDLYLPHWPIVMTDVDDAGIWENASSTSLTQDTGDLTGDFIVVGDEDGDDESVGEEKAWGRIIRLHGSWPRGTRNIKAIYRGGYETIPPGVKQLAMDWCAAEFQKADKKQFTATTETAAPGGSVTIAAPKMSDAVREKLKHWKRDGVW